MMTRLDMLYREVVLDHHRHPRGKVTIARVDAEGRGHNPACGDEVSIQLQLDGDTIADIAVQPRGCAISRASASMLAEAALGGTVAEFEALANGFQALLRGEQVPAALDLGDLEALGGVREFPARVKCAVLAWKAARNALETRERGRSSTIVSTEGDDDPGESVDPTRNHEQPPQMEVSHGADT